MIRSDRDSLSTDVMLMLKKSVSPNVPFLIYVVMSFAYSFLTNPFNED